MLSAQADASEAVAGPTWPATLATVRQSLGFIPDRVDHAGHGPEPGTAIIESQGAASDPQRGERGVDGKRRLKGVQRHVPTSSLGFVLAALVTAANAHETAAAGALLDRAAGAGWAPERIKADPPKAMVWRRRPTTEGR